jgi:hypothetical protein
VKGHYKRNHKFLHEKSEKQKELISWRKLQSTESVECHSWNFCFSEKGRSVYFMTFFIYLFKWFIFSTSNFIKLAVRSTIINETHAACIALKTINYMPDIKHLSAKVLQQQSH